MRRPKSKMTLEVYNIAVIHQAQERPDDALEFYRKAYEVFEQQGNKWKLEVN